MASVGGAAAAWSTAFHSLLESVLRDGEDMAIVLAYSAVRRHFRRLGHILDSVVEPRLVILDVADDSNVLVAWLESKSREEGSGPKARSAATGSTKQPDAADVPEGQHHDEETAAKRKQTTAPARSAGSSIITVTGLHDWSNSVFGDPLLAQVFCGERDADFLRGFEMDEDLY